MRRHTHQAYLLRIWRDRAEAPVRAMLITVATPHHEHHFATLDALQSFLLDQARAATPRDTQEEQQTPASTDNYCTPDQA